MAAEKTVKNFKELLILPHPVDT